jgi:hypothetical protein
MEEVQMQRKQRRVGAKEQRALELQREEKEGKKNQQNQKMQRDDALGQMVNEEQVAVRK